MKAKELLKRVGYVATDLFNGSRWIKLCGFFCQHTNSHVTLHACKSEDMGYLSGFYTSRNAWHIGVSCCCTIRWTTTCTFVALCLEKFIKIPSKLLSCLTCSTNETSVLELKRTKGLRFFWAEVTQLENEAPDSTLCAVRLRGTSVSFTVMLAFSLRSLQCLWKKTRLCWIWRYSALVYGNIQKTFRKLWLPVDHLFICLHTLNVCLDL